MKNIIYWFSAILLMSVAGACTQDELTFDHEQPAFDIKDGKILLEVVMPSTTKTDDIIFISGQFNGGDEVAAANTIWHLEKSLKISSKWGIYLNPEDFAEGTSLADGFHFVSVSGGIEKTAKNEDVNRTINPAPGTRTTLYVSTWANALAESEYPAHDGFRVYVSDNTGWDAIALYQWGDVNDFGGSWPGVQPGKDKILIGTTEWKYFDFSDEANGLAQNLIFNNNGGGVQLADFAHTFAAKDIFLNVTGESVELIENPTDFSVTIPEMRVYVAENTSGLTGELYVYGSMAGADAGFGAWPGIKATTDEETGEVYFIMPDSAYGQTVDLVFSSTDSPASYDFQATIDRHFHIALTPEGVKDAHVKTVYVQNGAEWEKIAMYGYTSDDKVVTEGWPGHEFTPQDEVIVNGITYYAYTFSYEFYDKTVNLIFNNTVVDKEHPLIPPSGKTDQEEVFTITLDKDHFITISPSGVESERKIYINNQTGWGEVAVYAYGDAEIFGGWPGAQPTGVETINGIDYQYVTIPVSAYGLNVSLIFNNNGAGEQLADIAVTLDESKAFELTADGPESGDLSTVYEKLYILDETGWDAIAVYAWGEVEAFGGWPGATPVEEKEIGGKTYKVFNVHPDHIGKNVNLIFNNNNGGTQLGDYNVTLSKDISLLVDSSSAKDAHFPRFYINDQSGWAETACYCWGPGEVFGGWPGALPSGTETVNGVEYRYFSIPIDYVGSEGVNPIFNNNNNGSQFDAPEGNIRLDRDYFYNITTAGVTYVE